jgi:SAM-dependent methyltransferase
MTDADDPHAGFPPGFFSRADPGDDRAFYRPTRLVTHIDDDAIAAVGALYAELGVRGRVLDLMSSWVSHFTEPPESLTVLGMNAEELAANPLAADAVVHDLNEDPALPFADATFDDVVCCVSVDYLVRPVEVFREVARVLVPGGRFVCTFSNRLFPTKAILGWRQTSDAQHVQIVAEYFRRAPAFGDVTADLRTPADHRGDPLFAVWAATAATTRPG